MFGMTVQLFEDDLLANNMSEDIFLHDFLEMLKRFPCAMHCDACNKLKYSTTQ